jgi:hypothetical protein
MVERLAHEGWFEDDDTGIRVDGNDDEGDVALDVATAPIRFRGREVLSVGIILDAVADVVDAVVVLVVVALSFADLCVFCAPLLAALFKS